MFDTGRLPLAANRWTPFAYSVAFIGYDFTGATFKAQVRDRKDGGFVRADMTVTLASVTTDEGVPTSTVDLEIPEATMEAMDAATERSEEHTSELQSLVRISYAVFCLKKKTYNQSKPYHQSTQSSHS